jgi:hypothetical protein
MNKTTALLLVLPWMAGAQSAPAPASPAPSAEARLDLRAGAGVVGYEERVSIEPVDSEWSAAVAELGARLSLWFPGLALEFSGDFWASGEDEEKWTGQGRLVQRNDLTVAGMEGRAAIGPRLGWAGPVQVQPWLSAGFRAQSFERERFVSAQGAFDPGTVEEDFALAFAGLSVDLRAEAGPNLQLGGRLGADYVFFNEAENSLFPATIEGEGGYVLRAETDLRLQVTPKVWLAIGLAVDLQELDGDAQGLLAFEDDRPSFNFVEWPDNTLERITGTLAVQMDW